MERTQLYLPKYLKKELINEAKILAISFAELVRRRLSYKPVESHPQKPNGVAQLLKAAARTKKMGYKGPKDLSINHDEYLYGDKRL